MPSPRLVSVNVGRITPEPWATPVGATAIDKRPVTGRVGVRRLGVAGDEQADRKHHGGVDQAVYVYAGEDLARWAAELDRELSPGQFGENLTTADLDVTGAVIGERWRIGSVVLEVSSPRIPCRVFAGWLDEPRWVKRFSEAGAPGAYLRVLTEGDLAAGDEIVVGHRPAHGVTIDVVFRALTGDRASVPRLLDAPELPAQTREKARVLLGS